MDTQHDNRLRSLVEDVLARVPRLLAMGLPSWQGAAAVELYRRHVLPYRLRFTPEEDETLARQVAAVVAGDILEELGNLGTTEKWSAVLRAAYFARLLP